MGDFFQLRKLDNELQSIINPVSFFDINPINLESEKHEVFKDPDYNPYFLYSKPKFDYDKMEIDLNSIEDHDSLLGRAISQKRDLFIDKCEMLRNRGSGKFSVFARKVYGLPDKNVLERAISFLTLDPAIETKTLPAENAAYILKAELAHYGFDYSVAIKMMGASAMVNAVTRKISLKKDSCFSENYVRRLITHEIGTHVLRAENGREQPFMIFFHGFPGYISTEEGLAVVNEERFGLLNNETLKRYAARAIAVKMSLEKGFSEIYNYLLEFFNQKTAFKIAARVKRGVSDTSKPGGCPKDHVYIQGYLKVKEYITSGGSLTDLYVGKIGVEHVNDVKQMKNIISPRFLPKNQTFKSLLSF